MVGSCDVRFPIRLEGLVLTHCQFSSYEPELFPGLIYRMVKPRIVLLIFVSGKVRVNDLVSTSYRLLHKEKCITFEVCIFLFYFYQWGILLDHFRWCSPERKCVQKSTKHLIIFIQFWKVSGKHEDIYIYMYASIASYTIENLWIFNWWRNVALADTYTKQNV